MVYLIISLYENIKVISKSLHYKHCGHKYLYICDLVNIYQCFSRAQTEKWNGFVKGSGTFISIDTPQSLSKWLDYYIKAAISPYFCHHFTLRNFYLKGESNVSFSLHFSN